MSDMPKYARHGIAMLNKLIAAKEAEKPAVEPPTPEPTKEKPDGNV